MLAPIERFLSCLVVESDEMRTTTAALCTLALLVLLQVRGPQRLLSCKKLKTSDSCLIVPQLAVYAAAETKAVKARFESCSG